MNAPESAARDQVAERAIALCQRLVQLESLSGREAAAAALVEATMGELGFDSVERDRLGSVVGVRRGVRAGPAVLLDAHLDVVAATQPERWRHAPFSGERSAGRVWGRGATDVKGSLAALLVGVGALPRETLGGTVVVSASVGEERMEGRALGEVLTRHPVDAVVICEPTGLRLVLGHKGRTSLVVESAGRAAHTSQPSRGVNAVYRMVEAIPALRRLELPYDAVLGAGVIELVEISSAPFPGSSMVPYHCSARFDRRLVRGETREGVLAQVRAQLAGIDGVTARYHHGVLDCYTGARFEEEVFHPSWTLDTAHPVARAAAAALASAGQDGAPTYAPYCTNGCCSAGERGLPTLVYGAGHIDDAHAVDEGVDEQQLVGALWGYQALARALTTAGYSVR